MAHPSSLVFGQHPIQGEVFVLSGFDAQGRFSLAVLRDAAGDRVLDPATFVRDAAAWARWDPRSQVASAGDSPGRERGADA